MLTENELLEIEARCNLAKPGPWKAFLKGQDFESGLDIIKTGSTNYYEGNDIEIFGATKEDLNFIANAKQDIPKLIQTIRQLINNSRL